jgi:hypothetical protein
VIGFVESFHAGHIVCCSDAWLSVSVCCDGFFNWISGDNILPSTNHMLNLVLSVCRMFVSLNLSLIVYEHWNQMMQLLSVRTLYDVTMVYFLNWTIYTFVRVDYLSWNFALHLNDWVIPSTWLFFGYNVLRKIVIPTFLWLSSDQCVHCQCRLDI